jgi:hypothetical protein
MTQAAQKWSAMVVRAWHLLIDAGPDTDGASHRQPAPPLGPYAAIYVAREEWPRV